MSNVSPSLHKITNPIKINVHRGALNDNGLDGQHTVAAWAFDENGSCFGECAEQIDTQQRIFLRSAAKPFQAAAALKAAHFFGFTDQEIAVACASHLGEIQHAYFVQSMLQKIGLDAKNLHNKTVNNDFKRLTQGCSGNHALMIALTMYLGINPKNAIITPEQRDHLAQQYTSNARWRHYINTYYLKDHPTDKHIRKYIADIIDKRPEDLKYGADGCNVPTFGVKPEDVGKAYARLASDHRFKHSKDLRYIRKVMHRHPTLIHGKDGFDTQIMKFFRNTPYTVISKHGYEGLHAIAITDNRGKGSAYVFKVRDGSQRATWPAVIAYLYGTGLLTKEMLDSVPQPTGSINFDLNGVVALATPHYSDKLPAGVIYPTEIPHAWATPAQQTVGLPHALQQRIKNAVLRNTVQQTFKNVERKMPRISDMEAPTLLAIYKVRKNTRAHRRDGRIIPQGIIDEK